MSNHNRLLLFKDITSHPERECLSLPETKGLRHIVFVADSLGTLDIDVSEIRLNWYGL